MKKLSIALLTLAISLPTQAAPNYCKYVDGAAFNAMIKRHKFEDINDAIDDINKNFNGNQVAIKLVKNAYEYDPVFKNQPFFPKISEMTREFASEQKKLCDAGLL